jgi:hypothetical protein
MKDSQWKNLKANNLSQIIQKGQFTLMIVQLEMSITLISNKIDPL